MSKRFAGTLMYEAEEWIIPLLSSKRVKMLAESAHKREGDHGG
jgi:hypothetical protein